MLISSHIEKGDSVSCEDNRPKRTWVYYNSPKQYGIPPCSCGNEDIEWSEYKGHIWCGSCERDFIPEHNGVFDGPILFEAAELLGMDFDKIDLTRDVYQKCERTEEELENFDLLTKEEIEARRNELQEKSEEFCRLGGFHREGNKIVLNG